MCIKQGFLSTQTNNKYISFVHCNSEFTPLDSAGSLSTTYQLPTVGRKNHTPNSHVLTFCTIWTCSYICLSMFHPANMGHSWSFNSSWIKRRMWKLEVGWGYSLHYPGASINLSGFPFHQHSTLKCLKISHKKDEFLFGIEVKSPFCWSKSPYPNFLFSFTMNSQKTLCEQKANAKRLWITGLHHFKQPEKRCL